MSVVIPVHNDERFVVEALDSILAQTLLPDEVIVVDDASTDGTPTVLREYVARQSGRVPIRVIRVDEQCGAAGARNAGAELARGRWIGWCDSDDVWLPTKLERQLEFVEKWDGAEPLVALGTHAYNVDVKGRTINVFRAEPTTYEQFLERRGRHQLFLIPQSSVLVDRAACRAAGGYRPGYLAVEDADLWTRMASLGAVVVVDEPQVKYRKRPGSLQHEVVFEQQDHLARVRLNWIRRDRGEAELSLAEARAHLADAPVRKRLRHWRRARGRFHYRRGSVAAVNGAMLRGALHLALAGALRPGLVLSGVRGAMRHRRGR